MAKVIKSGVREMILKVKDFIMKEKQSDFPIIPLEKLDAVELDNQVEELLKQQIFNTTKYVEPGILQSFMPEIDLLIRTWIFKYSIYDKKCSFGQNMLSLKYKDNNFTKRKMFWYFGCVVGIKYLKERALYSFTSNVGVQNFLHKLDILHLIGDIFNFLRFIRTGKQPTLIDLFLGLELAADKLTREDLTDFSWTRELLWHNFIELIGTAIALMNIFGLKKIFTHMLKYVWWRQRRQICNKVEKPTMTLETLCTHCSNRPVLPHHMGCSHIFCYYCLTANKTVDEDYACPKCYLIGKKIEKCSMV